MWAENWRYPTKRITKRWHDSRPVLNGKRLTECDKINVLFLSSFMVFEKQETSIRNLINKQTTTLTSYTNTLCTHWNKFTEVSLFS